MTHILIPIKDIKDKIGEREYQEQFEAEHGENYYQLQLLRDLLFEGKQISLDEKDIRQKAHEFQATLPDLTVYHNEAFVGYEQALKDLL